MPMSTTGRSLPCPSQSKGYAVSFPMTSSKKPCLVLFALLLGPLNLVAKRPEGEVRLALSSHTGTQDFQIDFRSSIDPRVITPALEDEKQKKGFDYFSFETPPVVEGRGWGRWRERERTGFRASVAATNFTFRAQQVDGFAAGVSFANGFLSMTNAVVRRPEGEATVDALGFDTRPGKTVEDQPANRRHRGDHDEPHGEDRRGKARDETCLEIGREQGKREAERDQRHQKADRAEKGGGAGFLRQDQEHAKDPEAIAEGLQLGR